MTGTACRLCVHRLPHLHIWEMVLRSANQQGMLFDVVDSIKRLGVCLVKQQRLPWVAPIDSWLLDAAASDKH